MDRRFVHLRMHPHRRAIDDDVALNRVVPSLPIAELAAEFRGELLRPFDRARRNRDVGPRAQEGGDHGPRRAARAEHQYEELREVRRLHPFRQGLGIEVRPQRFERGGVVGVGREERPVGPRLQSVCGPHDAHHRIAFLRPHRRGLLVWDRHAVAADRHGVQRVGRFGKLTLRHAEGDVHRIDLRAPEHVVVQDRAEAVAHRVAEQREELRVRPDGLHGVGRPELVHRRQAGGDAALFVERGVDPRRPELERREPRDEPELAHAERHGRLRRPPLDFDDPAQVVRLRGHHGDLADVRVLRQHPVVDLVEVSGRLGHVVVTDDALHRPEPADAIGDIGFEIDPLERPGDDGLPQHRLALRFGPRPATAVDRPAEGRHPRATLVGQQPFEIDRLREEIDADFEELGPARRGFAEFDLHHLVASPGHDPADFIRPDWHG